MFSWLSCGKKRGGWGWGRGYNGIMRKENEEKAQHRRQYAARNHCLGKHIDDPSCNTALPFLIHQLQGLHADPPLPLAFRLSLLPLCQPLLHNLHPCLCGGLSPLPLLPDSGQTLAETGLKPGADEGDDDESDDGGGAVVGAGCEGRPPLPGCRYWWCPLIGPGGHDSTLAQKLVTQTENCGQWRRSQRPSRPPTQCPLMKLLLLNYLQKHRSNCQTYKMWPALTKWYLSRILAL